MKCQNNKSGGIKRKILIVFKRRFLPSLETLLKIEKIWENFVGLFILFFHKNFEEKQARVLQR